MDMIYPLEVYYGDYKMQNDSVQFNCIPLDSIIIETNKGWNNKLLFCGDTLTMWDDLRGLKKSFTYASCIKKGDEIVFETSGLKNNVFCLTGKQWQVCYPVNLKTM